MTNDAARRRYFRVFFPATAIYLVSFIGTAWLGRHVIDNLLVTALLALVPIGALLAMFWAHLRLIGEIDEFLRSIQIKAVIAGLTAVLVVATGWGSLEMLAEVPQLDIFWLNPLYWIAYGLAVAFFTFQATGQLE